MSNRVSDIIMTSECHTDSSIDILGFGIKKLKFNNLPLNYKTLGSASGCLLFPLRIYICFKRDFSISIWSIIGLDGGAMQKSLHLEPGSFDSNSSFGWDFYVPCLSNQATSCNIPGTHKSPPQQPTKYMKGLQKVHQIFGPAIKTPESHIGVPGLVLSLSLQTPASLPVQILEGSRRWLK